MNKNRKPKKRKSSWNVIFDKLTVKDAVKSQKVCWHTHEPLDEETAMVVEVLNKEDVLSVTILSPKAMDYLLKLKKEADQKGHTLKLYVNNPNMTLPS